MTSQLGDAYLLARQKHPIINQSSANDYHSGRPSRHSYVSSQVDHQGGFINSFLFMEQRGGVGS